MTLPVRARRFIVTSGERLVGDACRFSPYTHERAGRLSEVRRRWGRRHPSPATVRVMTCGSRRRSVGDVSDEPRNIPSELVVYVDHSDIREGRLEDLEAGIRRLVEVIRSREPRLLAYGFHLDEDGGRMTVVAVHPDAASLELHLEVGREEFRRLGDMITLQRIEVYGSISPGAREMLQEKAAMLGGSGVTVVERFAGFARLPTVEA